MGMNWEKGKGPTRGSESCNVHLQRPGQRSLVCFLSDAEGIFSSKVHWIREENKAFPCFGGECKFCPWPSQTRWYAPILVYLPSLPPANVDWDPPEPPYLFSTLKWRKMVLEITVGWSAIVQQAAVAAIFELVRSGQAKQSRTRFRHLGKLEGVESSPFYFDPRPVLENMWGLRKERRW